MADPGSPPVLSDGVVLLRPPAPGDLADLVQTVRDPQFVRWTTVPSPYDEAMAEEFLAPRLDSATWWQEPYWVITVVPEDRFCGAIDLRPDGAGGAVVGFGMSPWARGHGHMTRALRLVSTWGLTAGRLEVVMWEGLVGNTASRRVAERAGFRVHDAVLRKHVVQRGTRADIWVGEMTAEDLGTPRRDRYASVALTRREREVLDLIAAGHANRTIATTLKISEHTVKNHVRSILEKLQAHSRVDAVVKGVQAGLTRLP